uniref:Uncharacterized protein n=1 Tax=Arundo donax TaxID=35708 RepID=A0A0A9AG38_ARUDO
MKERSKETQRSAPLDHEDLQNCSVFSYPVPRHGHFYQIELESAGKDQQHTCREN